MIDKLRAAFPHIDWSERNDPETKARVVEGPLNGNFLITIFDLGKKGHVAALHWCLVKLESKERTWRPLLRSPRPRLDPCDTIKDLLKQTPPMLESIAALHDNFL